MFSNRRKQTRFAIVGALAIHGDMDGLTIARIIGVKGGTLYPDLAWLEQHQYIFSAWQEGDYPRRRIYWLNPNLPLRRANDKAT